MGRDKLLLAAGVAGILVVSLAPYARQQWDARQLRAEQEQRRLYIEAKEREIACLERLLGGVPQRKSLEAEIDRCRRLSLDPETGEPQAR